MESESTQFQKFPRVSGQSSELPQVFSKWVNALTVTQTMLVIIRTTLLVFSTIQCTIQLKMFGNLDKVCTKLETDLMKKQLSSKILMLLVSLLITTITLDSLMAIVTTKDLKLP